jgi:hypothetical protein
MKKNFRDELKQRKQANNAVWLGICMILIAESLINWVCFILGKVL